MGISRAGCDRTSRAPGSRARLASLTAASAFSNAPGKLLSHRPRPQPHRVPLPHRFLNHPDSTSFPSGYTASAVAFALAASFEQPALTAPLGLLAVAVAYGRLYTPVHYPGDILAGALIGTASAWTTTRLAHKRPALRALRAQATYRQGQRGTAGSAGAAPTGAVHRTARRRDVGVEDRGGCVRRPRVGHWRVGETPRRARSAAGRRGPAGRR